VKAERESVERALQIDATSIDAWAYLTNAIKEQDGEEAAIKKIEELAQAPVNAKTAAPYIALQGFFATDEKTRDKGGRVSRRRLSSEPRKTRWRSCASRRSTGRPGRSTRPSSCSRPRRR